MGRTSLVSVILSTCTSLPLPAGSTVGVEGLCEAMMTTLALVAEVAETLPARAAVLVSIHILVVEDTMLLGQPGQAHLGPLFDRAALVGAQPDVHQSGELEGRLLPDPPSGRRTPRGRQPAPTVGLSRSTGGPRDSSPQRSQWHSFAFTARIRSCAAVARS